MEANTTIRITGAPTGGSIKAIPSKSAAHRILIAAALSGLDLRDHCKDLSRDITATKECLAALMFAKAEAAVSKSRRTYASAEQSRDSVPGSRALLPCGESGSTLRFLIPAAGVLGIDAEFLCEGRLPDRPMEPYLSVLAEHGCIVNGRNPKVLQGRLRGGEFRLPGDISSQYITGLLMSLPLAEEDSRIIVEGRLQSRPYIDMTLEVMEQANIRIEEEPQGISGQSTVFFIPGKQQYRLPEETLEHIEGDWSNAAFWITMDAMLSDGETKEEMIDRAEGDHADDAFGNRIICYGLDPASAQGDRRILQVIEQIRSADSLLPRSEKAASAAGSRIDISVIGRLGFVELDVSDIPDLVPIIAAFACTRYIGAVTHITGAARLRFKESDRLQAVTETLRALGADITEEPAGLMIRGIGTLAGGEVDSFGDHRIVMMAAAAACASRDDIIIRGAEAVEKSYPSYFDDYKQLGGTWEIEEL